jgi:ribonuclease HI
LIVYCDGAARGNPGPAGLGVFITQDDGRLVHEIARGLGEATNNVAEYSALVAGLEWCVANSVDSVKVRADSDLVIKQMQGIYKVKSKNLMRLHNRARELASSLAQVSFEHVRREFNKDADRLANLGVDEWLAAGRPAVGDPTLF